MNDEAPAAPEGELDKKGKGGKNKKKAKKKKKGAVLGNRCLQAGCTRQL